MAVQTSVNSIDSTINAWTETDMPRKTAIERAQAHLDAADSIVMAEVDRLARRIMRALPEIERFDCGMGSALFSAYYRRLYDDGSMGDTPELDQWSVCGMWTGFCDPPPELQPLIDLFDRFDAVFKMSGVPITIFNPAHVARRSVRVVGQINMDSNMSGY